ncbi:hypothetical protein BV898_06289 [Hypsibius exemplaris]|uniref:Uncharacterized protein n=1 Tax=Hypsibius exemplaris TaxID=2072580 RepID=A0A1W0WX26_HYPEX|nr:hypothetical protein BV898_06289 [Hypsibius exemplaris]
MRADDSSHHIQLKNIKAEATPSQISANLMLPEEAQQEATSIVGGNYHRDKKRKNGSTVRPNRVGSRFHKLISTTTTHYSTKKYYQSGSPTL